MDERTAIERLKEGDIDGLEILVKEHQIRAVRAAYLIVRSRPLAEDVVQGAFVKAYEKIAHFDLRRPFAPWFTKIVVNDATKAAKRRERTVPLQDSDDEPDIQLADTALGPQELAEASEIRRRVWFALEKLSPVQRAVIVQRYYLGMSEAEMAKDGMSPPGTIKWRLHAARKRLAKLLGPDFCAQEVPVSFDKPTVVDASGGGEDRA
ncbi:MAG: RNA polymerase sigma factor [Rubrobacteraceae bacterium]